MRRLIVDYEHGTIAVELADGILIYDRLDRVEGSRVLDREALPARRRAAKRR